MRQTVREQIVEFIADFHTKNGYAPTVREIGTAVGLLSSSTVHHHLQSLAREGRITSNADQPRTLRVVPPKRRAS